MTRILGLSGSLRKGSLNTSLLHEAVRLMPAGSTLDARTLHGVPLYDGDLEEAEGVPAAVAALKQALAQADGLLLVTPEYNSGVPGVFKNAIDWMSRGRDGQAAFAGKPVALIGASMSGFGTVSSQDHWLPVLRRLGTRLWTGGQVLVSRAQDAFDDEGRLKDAATADRLARFMSDFGDFAARG